MKNPIVFALFLVTFAAAFHLIIKLGPRRVRSSQNACVANIKYLERAKSQWLALHMTNSLAPRNAFCPLTAEDLFGHTWTNKMVDCPDGGVYRIGNLHEKTTCSLGPPKHTLP